MTKLTRNNLSLKIVFAIVSVCVRLTDAEDNCLSCACDDDVMTCENVILVSIPYCASCPAVDLTLTQNELASLVLPQELRTSMKSLRVSQNPVTDWDSFHIEEFSSLSHLRFNQIDMSASELVLELSKPAPSVESLHVTYCSLHTLSAFPPLRKFLPNLHWLHLEGNYLETVPLVEYLPATLLQLNLKGNKIKRLTPLTFPAPAQLPTINILDFSANPVDVFSPEIIGRELTELSLEGAWLPLFDFQELAEWIVGKNNRVGEPLTLDIGGTKLACTCYQALGLLALRVYNAVSFTGGPGHCGDANVTCVSCQDEEREAPFNGGPEALREFIDLFETDKCISIDSASNTFIGSTDAITITAITAASATVKPLDPRVYDAAIDHPPKFQRHIDPEEGHFEQVTINEEHRHFSDEQLFADERRKNSPQDIERVSDDSIDIIVYAAVGVVILIAALIGGVCMLLKWKDGRFGSDEMADDRMMY